MTDKELVKQLKNLTAIKADADFKARNCEILLSQIKNSGALSMSGVEKSLIYINNFFKTALQPAFSLAIFVCIMLVGAAFSHKILNGVKPNESMYLARVLSERVKLRMVWDEMEKEKMEIKFASNHAKDIATVLADETFTKENNQQEIEKLNNEFKVEIRTVKRKMNQIVAKKLENTISTTEVTEKVNTASVNEDNEKVFSANTKKEEIGIQVSEPIVPEPNTVSAKVEEKKEVTVNTDKLLEEAQNSFDQKDYDSALDKLKQVDNLLGN